MSPSNQKRKREDELNASDKTSLIKIPRKRNKTQQTMKHRKKKRNRRKRTLKMRFLLVDSKASPPRKWMFHTSTITAAAAASTCDANVNGSALTPTNPPISSPLFSSPLLSSLAIFLPLFFFLRKRLARRPGSLCLYLWGIIINYYLGTGCYEILAVQFPQVGEKHMSCHVWTHPFVWTHVRILMRFGYLGWLAGRPRKIDHDPIFVF